eukprot:342831-Chlamydomonas_euryale.AAC.1
MVVDLQRQAFAGAAGRGMEAPCAAAKLPSAQVLQGRSPPAPLPPRSPPITSYHDAGVTPQLC